MPSHSLGRRAPVRGDAPLLQGGTTLHSSTASSNTSNQHHQHTNNLPNSSSSSSSSSRPFSSGAPAAATAVPVLPGAQRGANAFLPDSPPCTPPASPPTSSFNLINVHAQRMNLNDEQQEQVDTLQSSSRRRTGSRSRSASPTALATLKAAAAGVAMTRASVPAAQDASRSAGSSSSSSNAVASSSTAQRSTAINFGTSHPPSSVARPIMPSTPEQTPLTMSPADMVRHHPTASAQAFLASLYPTLYATSARSVGVAQDAGVELTCPAWTGAVLDRSTTGAGTTSTRTLHVRMPPTLHDQGLRDDVVSILDLASEKLACGRVIVALERDAMPDFPSTLHGLCYVGAQVVKCAELGVEELTPKEGIILAAIDLL